MERIELQPYKTKLPYTLGQLEIDYYQHFILAKLYETFNTLYFKGGTCLQKCYGIKRFSEDLDFNYEKIEMKRIISLIESLCNAKIRDYKETRFGISFSIRIKGILYNGSPESLCKITFDFRENDTYNPPLKKMIRPIYADLPRYFLLALDEEEIVAEKISAVLTRYKARDVYDLNELLINGVTIHLALVNKKLRTYNKTFMLTELEEKIEEKRSIYDQEMKRLTHIYEDFNACKERILAKVKNTMLPIGGASHMLGP